MIAHTRSRECRFITRRAHQIHQPGTRPVGGGIKARLVYLVPVFSVTRDLGIDQALICRRQVLVTYLQPFQHAGWEIGHEYVSCADQVEQDFVSRINFHIKNHPTLVTVIVLEHVVQFAGWEGRHLVRIAVRIPNTGALDLNHLRTKIGHHGGTRRTKDIGRHVYHLNTGQDPLRHTLLLSCVDGLMR